MRQDKDIAVKLRKAGKTYNEISQALTVPKSTLHAWFAHEVWSEKIKKGNYRSIQSVWFKNGERLAAFNRKRFGLAVKQHRKQAQDEFQTLRSNPLFIAGIMLYWGEGEQQTSPHVRITNTNPDMIRLFIKFLSEICCVPRKKIRVGIILYPDLDKKICEAFWRHTTHIPKEQFHKTQVIHGKSKRGRLVHGICLLTVSSRALKERILVWDQFVTTISCVHWTK